MQEIAEGLITVAAGLEGDYKGARHPRRQITVLAREAWQAALAELGAAGLAWTTRRANLLVEGVELPRGRGGLLQVGPVRLEVTGPTHPCIRMEQACEGLLRALARDARGGVTCRVLVGGHVALGCPVEVLSQGRERAPRLPG
jgi:MOSC domain-containing protein YiiM